MRVARVAFSLASVWLLLSCQSSSSTHTGAATPTGKGPHAIYLPTEVRLSAPSARVVWALVAGSLLFRSSDSGANFDQRPLPPQQVMPKPEISFADGLNGWLATGGSPEGQCNGAGDGIWRTTDAGATWQKVASVDYPQQAGNGIGYSQCKEGLSFVDATHGFLAAWDPNHRPTIYRTSDAGLTWAPSTLPDPPGFVTQGGGFALRAGLVRRFGGLLLVPAWGRQDGDAGDRTYVFESSDGGRSWQYLAKAPSSSDDVAFVTGSRWLLLAPADSAETTDSGTTWHSFTSDYQQAAGVPPQVVFADSEIGYATVRGGIQRTADGGLHWSIIETPGVFWPG